jgi:hypothetical protein
VIRTRDREPNAGSATLLVVVVVVVLASVALAVGRFGRGLNDAARAQTAADAAALAGSVGGRDRASDLATANHAVLVSFVEIGASVRVVVTVDGVVATARASSD